MIHNCTHTLTHIDTNLSKSSSLYVNTQSFSHWNVSLVTAYWAVKSLMWLTSATLDDANGASHVRLSIKLLTEALRDVCVCISVCVCLCVYWGGIFTPHSLVNHVNCCNLFLRTLIGSYSSVFENMITPHHEMNLSRISISRMEVQSWLRFFLVFLRQLMSDIILQTIVFSSFSKIWSL